MSARASRPSPGLHLGLRLGLWGTLGALSLCLSGCKPEAVAAGVPAQAPAAEPSPPSSTTPAADADAKPAEPVGADGSATLAAVGGGANPGDPDALDPQPADVEAEVAKAEPETPALPEEPYKVLILGDSLAATGFGALLERKLDAHPHVDCFREGKSASGLARPDFFDWLEMGKKHAEFRQPDLVVVIMGGNDGQDITRRKNGDGKRTNWKTEGWATEYRARVDAFLASVAAPGRKVLWLGLPFMGLRSLEEKLTLIRSVQEAAVVAQGDGHTYLDTVPFVTTEDGKMLTEAKVGPRGKSQTLRAEDKIHFTMAGSEYFADRVYPEVLDALGLPDVQADPSAKP
jgi:uncharacterized protein